MGKVRTSNNRKNSRGLNKQLVFDAALAVGSLSFALSLWKVPGFLQFATSLSIGIVAGLLTYGVILFVGKLLPNRFEEQSSDSTDSQIDENNDSFDDRKRANDMTLSIHSPSNYESSPDKRVKRPRLAALLPKHWSSLLVDSIEWRVFDRLCIAFWRLKGNKISGIAERTNDGIDFFISAPTNKQFRIAVVQTRSSHARTPTVDDMRNLLKLKETNNLSVAILMFAGKLSKVVHSYCASNDIRLLSSDKITKGLEALPKEDQEQLLKALIRPDYMIPSCPNCLIKLVKRQSIKSGRVFWGCISYPKCNFTINT